MRAGELEYWLVSPSERVVRVELVHPTNKDRHALLQQLCAQLPGPLQLPNHTVATHALLDQFGSSDRVRPVRRWNESEMAHDGGVARSDGAAAGDTYQTRLHQLQHQTSPCVDSISLLPIDRVETDIGASLFQLTSVAFSKSPPPCGVGFGLEMCQSAGVVAADGWQLSSLSAMSSSSDCAVSFVSRSVTEPLTRPAAHHGHSSPLLCPTTPPLPQPSPFVLSTDESHNDRVAAGIDEQVSEPTFLQPVRTCTMRRTHSTAPPFHPSPVMFPRQLPSTVTAAASLLDSKIGVDSGGCEGSVDSSGPVDTFDGCSPEATTATSPRKVPSLSAVSTLAQIQIQQLPSGVTAADSSDSVVTRSQTSDANKRSFETSAALSIG